MELLAVMPYSAFVIAALVLLGIILKFRFDYYDVKSAQSLNTNTLTLAKKHYRPSLTILLNVTDVELTKQQITTVRAAYKQATIVAVVTTQRTPKAARQLRYYKTKLHAAGLSVVTRRMRQTIHDIALTYATGDLVLAIDDADELLPSFYDVALFPFIDPSLVALRLTRAPRIDNTISRGLAACRFAFVQYGKQIGSRRVAANTLPLYVVMRRASLQSAARSIRWAPRASIHNPAQLLDSFRYRHAVSLVAHTFATILLAWWIASLPTEEQLPIAGSLIILTCIATGAAITRLHFYRFSDRAALLLLTPLFVVALVIMPYLCVLVTLMRFTILLPKRLPLRQIAS